MLDPSCLCPIDQQETFWSLLHNGAHWGFEFFIQLLDATVIGIGWRLWCWPRLRKHLGHHECPPDEKKTK
jgi:hypothetical protein